MNKHFIVGFCGKHQVGKDTVLDRLKQSLDYKFKLGKNEVKVIKASFGDIIKDEIAMALDIPLHKIENNKNKPEIRWILEQYGMNYRRKNDGEDYFVNKAIGLIEAVEQPSIIMISSVRLLNEVAMIREHFGGQVILIRREPTDAYGYVQDPPLLPSEVEIDKLKYDYAISNNWTKLRLQKTVDDFLISYLLPKIELWHTYHQQALISTTPVSDTK